MNIPQLPDSAHVETNIMRADVDPVVAHITRMGRLCAVEARDFSAERVALGEEIGTFLQGLTEGQVIRTEDESDFNLRGGALFYETSNGQAYVWFDVWYGKNPDEEPEFLTADLMCSLREPYAEDAESILNFGEHADALYPEIAVVGQEDVNLCAGLLRRMKTAYPAPKAVVETVS